jgi:hypothetical protein
VVITRDECMRSKPGAAKCQIHDVQRWKHNYITMHISFHKISMWLMACCCSTAEELAGWIAHLNASMKKTKSVDRSTIEM